MIKFVKNRLYTKWIFNFLSLSIPSPFHVHVGKCNHKSHISLWYFLPIRAEFVAHILDKTIARYSLRPISINCVWLVSEFYKSKDMCDSECLMTNSRKIYKFCFSKKWMLSNREVLLWRYMINMVVLSSSGQYFTYAFFLCNIKHLCFKNYRRLFCTSTASFCVINWSWWTHIMTVSYFSFLIFSVLAINCVPHWLNSALLISVPLKVVKLGMKNWSVFLI